MNKPQKLIASTFFISGMFFLILAFYAWYDSVKEPNFEYRFPVLIGDIHNA